ncbi:TetR/AcrR family transcriptional regulator [Kibdelosporangium aridum]|uniref:TetR/AcrR family transcriptional regulator n=1 Tax=Kibdelosporangium aridum TaxID=2030 RepID=A0A428Z503_KIBAR|nr:TetR/AcrR family transcriptional regulator [Kibdelosporangium aridum]RSM81909.1 TetR/AcrR family transcriptional regulator [Kibdelosporangium aridum]
MSSGVRAAQRAATRQRIVQTAVDLLVDRGLAATTTVEVQRAGGFSRGALLHHFPTREAMLGATIRLLMERNEAAVQQAEAEVPADLDRVERAIRVLCASIVRPAFVAELELWAAARTDTALRDVLRREEKRARTDLYRVIGEVFGADVVAHERYPVVASLTVQFLRGLAISDVLRGERGSERLIADWIAVVRTVLEGSDL